MNTIIKVSETNISIDNLGNYRDCQSRVIEVSSWEEYIDEIKTKKRVERKCIVGNLFGISVPIVCDIDIHMKSDKAFIATVTNYAGMKTLKTAYKML